MTVIPRFTNSTAVPLPNESLPAGLSTGAKAGIGVSATMAAFGILVAILYLSMRKKKCRPGLSPDFPDAGWLVPTRAAQDVQCRRIHELPGFHSSPLVNNPLVNNPLAENPLSENPPPETFRRGNYDVGHNFVLNEPISDLTLLNDDPPLELHSPPPVNSSDLDGGRDYPTMGKPHR